MQTVNSLLQRYKKRFVMAWSLRHELDTPSRFRHESEFLPAALALRDTPVHPAPRVTACVIIGLVSIAIVWAIFGKVDVVASAPGKIVPSGDVKLIQPQDAAVVIAIYVKNGQRVRKGEALVDLDATDATADASRAQGDLGSTKSELARATAMLDAIDHHRAPALKLDSADGLPTALASETHVLDGEYADYASNVGQMDADIAQAQASLHEVEDEIGKLSSTLPIEEKKEKDYATLIEKGYVGTHDYYTEQQAVIQIKQDLAAQRDRRVEILATLEASRKKRDAYINNVRRTWLEKIHDDDQKVSELTQDLAKASQHRRHMHLTAPVDGTVQQLAIHTIGGVTTSAQTLMTLVPEGQHLQVEAIVDNQDIGFIKEGQLAEVKVETFPFSRYGTLRGTVIQVSNDAKQDDKLGLVFTAEVTLPRDTMKVDDRVITLTPGMAVTTEIKTGRRRIISYLLSPLVEHVQQSMHER